MKKILLLLVLLPFYISSLYAQDNYGLRFKSKEVIKKYRTGLDLTKNGAISYTSGFKIKFDISFRKHEGFGYIFRLKELKSENQIDLLCQLYEASTGLYLVLNKKETEAKINLSNILKKPTNDWNTVIAEFNADSEIIQLCFEGEKVTESIKFPTNSEFILTFGVVDNYGFDTREVPYASIRNISIYTDGQEKHHWSLNNREGNTVLDTINRKKAFISNPEWEVHHHLKWKYLNGITLHEKAQIAYDNKNEIIYLVCKNNKIYYLNLNENSFDSLTYEGLSPLYENDNQIIISKNSKIITYSHQENKKSIFDSEKLAWTPQLESYDSLPKYWHHNKLINPLDKKIVTICGYGFYTYKNDILAFNDSIHKWTNLHFKGDTIYPRYLSALGKNPKKEYQYYLFGGLGNKSGDQILGTEFYYDLYSIDFKDKQIKRIWQLDFKNNSNVTPLNTLIVDDSSTYFYTLCFPHHGERTYLRVFKASLIKPEYSFLGDSIPYYFNDIQSYADLYYWKSTRKLLAITLNKSGESTNEIKIYTLQFPPGSLNAINKQSVKASWFVLKSLFLLVGIILLISLFYIYKRKQNIKSPKIDAPLHHTNETLIDDIKPEPPIANSINLFGGFQVIDKKGKDITYRFSPTLKELFLLILLYSVKDNKGISSSKIQEILWSDKSQSSAKNNRGVNIKKLRSVLPDIGNIQITFDSLFWKLEFDENIFCDYYYINEALTDFTPLNLDENTYLINILKFLKRGNILINIETEWLDKFKGEISTKIVQFLELHLQNPNLKSHSNIILDIANTIALFDQLNEKALCRKCKVLTRLGEHGLAHNTYNSYSKLYLNIYGEEYQKAFKQVIKN